MFRPSRSGTPLQDTLAAEAAAEQQRQQELAQLKSAPLSDHERARLAKLATAPRHKQSKRKHAATDATDAGHACTEKPASAVPYEQLRALPPDPLANKMASLARPRTVTAKFTRTRATHEDFLQRRAALTQPLAESQRAKVDALAAGLDQNGADKAGRSRFERLPADPNVRPPSPARLAQLSAVPESRLRPRYQPPIHAPPPLPSAPVISTSHGHRQSTSATDADAEAEAEAVRAFRRQRKAEARARREEQARKTDAWLRARGGHSNFTGAGAGAGVDVGAHTGAGAGTSVAMTDGDGADAEAAAAAAEVISGSDDDDDDDDNYDDKFTGDGGEHDANAHNAATAHSRHHSAPHHAVHHAALDVHSHTVGATPPRASTRTATATAASAMRESDAHAAEAEAEAEAEAAAVETATAAAVAAARQRAREREARGVLGGAGWERALELDVAQQRGLLF